MTAELAPVDRVSEDTARARLERLLYLSVGFAAVLYGLVLFPGKNGIAGQTPQLHPWYGYSLVVVAVGLPLALGAVTWILPRRQVRQIAMVTAVLFLLGMMLFPLGMTTDTLIANATPWYQGIHALHGMILATAWQHRGVWLYGLAQGVVIGVVQATVRDDQVKAATLDGIGSLVFIVILMAATQGVIGAADRLDAASYLARSRAATAAASRTKEREETRINAMVHDDIMSVLLTASRENPPASLADQARVALASVETLESRNAAAREYTVKETALALVEVVQKLAPTTAITHREVGELMIPADAVTALADALAESLRNSVRHAGLDGAEVPRSVQIAATDAGMDVTLHDDGRGFNLRSVQQRRLGIKLSILERMSMVAGGSARIDSRPGEGTTVLLRWQAP